jgi:catechol 2,3-dioxygenase-like lactoylglutathione lyase family enzyme
VTGRALRLRGVILTVRDLPGMAAFYRDALGFAATDGGGRRLRLGAQHLELAAFDPPGADYPARSTAADLWFQHVAIVTGDMDAATRALGPFAVEAITQGGPQTLPASDGGVIAFKFRDPEGHPLELLQFPPGTGAAEWQCAGAFLGFDHSAISVGDAARSVDFYTSGLGLSVGSRTLNHGPAQERLDGLAAARVEVVALRPSEAPTPHVELLAYHPPGRPAPVLTPRDIAATRLDFAVDDIEAIAARIAFLPPGIVPAAGGARTALLRDPDGHLIRLVQS